MPIYKYECKSCGHIFEDLRGFNDPNPDACPECGEAQIERLISGGNFHLKGSGWYVTDYGGSSTGNSSSDSSSSSSDDSAGSGGSTEGSSDGTEAA
jgi:putative FmdB family regulatory protein